MVGVSWHEARAFCRWLEAHFEQNPFPLWEPDFEVGLPNNAEWGLAAVEGKTEYPWSDEAPNATRANYDGRLGRTSPVGIYPCGAAVKLFDLAGNVWEWNEDGRGKGLYFLRGGSWSDRARNLASSDRFGGGAGDRYRDIGFRCRLGPRASGK